jgi:hypothetical protein
MLIGKVCIESADHQTTVGRHSIAQTHFVSGNNKCDECRRSNGPISVAMLRLLSGRSRAGRLTHQILILIVLGSVARGPWVAPLRAPSFRLLRWPLPANLR